MTCATVESQPRIVERIEIHLKYEGPDVENGTMALQDVIPALQGFSGAYARSLGTENAGLTHRIRFSDIRQGSADIVLEIDQWLTDNSETIAAIAGLTLIGRTIAYPIAKRILEVIQIKAHVGADVPKERISVQNKIAISNSNNVTIDVSPEAHNLYNQKTLDNDLEKLTRPVKDGRINSAEFEVQAENQETIRQRITSHDRRHFEIKDTEISTSEERELVATLNSLTKSTNSGWLRLSNGERLFYRYIGENQIELHSIFGNYNGPVKIRCRELLDEDSVVKSLEILAIDRMQLEMF